MTTTTTRSCRSCQGTLDPFLDLGEIQLSGYLAPDEPARPTAPLTLAACSDCRLVQLLHTTPRELLFSHYWYRSGVNEVMRAELHDVVDDAVAAIDELERGDVVLDTGANDGTLLQRYRELQINPLSSGVLRVAYEPAANLQDELHKHADIVVADYFPNQFRSVQRLERKVKIITSIAMFYAVDDVHQFLAAISMLLHPDGVWVVQFQDLAGMMRARAFDNICHEHLVYYSVTSFARLLREYGLVVTRVQPRKINGGSVRLTVRHAHTYVPNHTVREALIKENWHQGWAGLETFAREVQDVKRQIRSVLHECVERGQIIDLYGASTKANTLLQV